jgi:FkbM family methyltransferase
MLFGRKYKYLKPLLVEKNEWNFYLDHIVAGDTVFDVGANIGELTLLFSKFCGSEGSVHSFEPTVSTFNKLQNLVNIFQLKNVKINNLAVTDQSGVISFNVYEEEFSSWNTLATRPLHNYGISIQEPKSVDIASISIDDYCECNSIKNIDLLKIDVEGSELNVLKGARKMFSEGKIKICVFEFGQTIFDMGNTIQEFKNFFSAYDYEIKNVSKDQYVFPVDASSGEAHFAVLYVQSEGLKRNLSK